MILKIQRILLNEKSGTGTYTGVITLDAAGGKVVANFTTSVAP